jgi:hypothetical protein
MSETCTRYSSPCKGGEAIADVTATVGENVNGHTLCALCIAGLTWDFYVRNGSDYAQDVATVEVTALVGDLDEDESRTAVDSELDAEFVYGNYRRENVAALVDWSV